MFKQLKDLLPREFNRHGLKSEIKALEVINVYNKSIIEIFGEQALNGIPARSYKNKKLYIDASNSSWAQALFLKQSYILERLQKKFKKSQVERLVINTVNK